MAKLKNKFEVFTVQSNVAGKPATVKLHMKKKSVRNWNHFKGRKKYLKRKKYPFVESFKDKNDDSNFIDGFYGLLTLLLLILAPFSITLIPMNNIFANPEYWYETVFSTISTALFMSIAGSMELNIVFNGHYNRGKLRMIAELFMINKTSHFLIICIIHIIWTYALGYYEPFPRRGIIAGNLAAFPLIIRGWYLIQKQARMKPTTRKRYKACGLRFIWIIFFNLQLAMVRDLFTNTFRDLQWMIALIAPLMKEINDRIIEINVIRYTGIGKINLSLYLKQRFSTLIF